MRSMKGKWSMGNMGNSIDDWLCFLLSPYSTLELGNVPYKARKIPTPGGPF